MDASCHQGTVCAAVAVFDFPHLKPIEQALVEIPLSFPYIPGLLSFREAPGILAALKPVYLSIGHRMHIMSPTEIILACKGCRLPEPSRQAHFLAKSACNRLKDK